MKKGFTMIELIFVIVILGVLASVAIPRLAATRDDAEVAKAATNLATAVSDLAAYYTAKGNFDGVSSDFTKVTNALDKNGNLNIKGKPCVSVTKLGNELKDKNGTVGFVLEFAAGTGNGATGDAACETLRKLSSVKAMCGKTGSNESIVANASDGCQIQVGGSGGIAW